jgi:GNAT superfamily N-acetyltransferase
MNMEIIEAAGKKQLDEFIRVPDCIYKDDPFYPAPMPKMMRKDFSAENPFFLHADVKLFTAKKEGKLLGRVASILNKRHIEFQKEKAGFFGFFECINDPDAASALIEKAAEELRSRGMEIIRGPMNFSTNEECGFLMEGFDEPPMLMTPYNPAYYNDLMKEAGMKKAKDLYGYIINAPDELPEKILRVAGIAEKRGIRVRPAVRKNFLSELRAFKEVYNSAWEENWGFVPFTEEEIDFMGEKLKEIAVPELTLIAEKEGEPVGFIGLVPDFNLVLRKMQGRINPVTIVKALYWSKRIKDLRLLLLGIKKPYRSKGVDALLFKEAFKGVKSGGYRRVEFSWILEDNLPVQRLVEMVGGRLYKKYRIYEKKI